MPYALYIRCMRDERRRLLEALTERAPRLAEEMVDRTRTEIPSFAAVPRDDQLGETVAFTLWLAGFSLGADVPELDSDRLADLGRRRAEQGIPVEDLLRSWRISVDVGIARAREVAAARELDP